MPIGWVNEGSSGRTRTVREPQRFTWAERARAAAQQVVHNLTGWDSASRQLLPTVWTRWETAVDDRVCPVCAPYAGRSWPAGEGPHPPLHPRCRCQRHHAFVTWSVRE